MLEHPCTQKVAWPRKAHGRRAGVVSGLGSTTTLDKRLTSNFTSCPAAAVPSPHLGVQCDSLVNIAKNNPCDYVVNRFSLFCSVQLAATAGFAGDELRLGREGNPNIAIKMHSV